MMTADKFLNDLHNLEVGESIYFTRKNFLVGEIFITEAHTFVVKKFLSFYCIDADVVENIKEVEDWFLLLFYHGRIDVD